MASIGQSLLEKMRFAKLRTFRRHFYHTERFGYISCTVASARVTDGSDGPNSG